LATHPNLLILSKTGRCITVWISTKQGVALTGRYTTGPPSRACCPLHIAYAHCICAAVDCCRRRQTTTDARQHH